MALFEQLGNTIVEEKLKKLKKEAEERDASRRAADRGLPYANLNDVALSLEALKEIPETEARAAQIAAIEINPKEIAFAIYDQTAAVDAIAARFKAKGFKIRFVVVSQNGLEAVWKRYEDIKTISSEDLGNVTLQNADVYSMHSLQERFAALEQEKNVSTTQLITYLFAGATTLDASDIHVEAQKESAKIRFRIDGVLYDIATISNRLCKLLLNRIKLLSELKINISDKPQDGRFSILRKDKQNIDVRVSFIPSEYGETAVMRVLDPKATQVTFEKLGFRDADWMIISKELKRPNGMVLVTGPTGCGKTTTLYSFLRYVHSPENKIITIEDPIEYHLDGVEQTQVDAKKGYTFESGLRSILRQDPDIILVGEIRDGETAKIAANAALTGHLVFSTLHTNDAVGAIPRLLDLGVGASAISSSLSVVMAQRLVRTLCDSCKIERKVTDRERQKIETFIAALPEKARPSRIPNSIYEARGCDKCRNGYKGRVGVFEILKITDAIKTKIVSGVSEESLKAAMRDSGAISMQEDGVLKVLQGRTTFEEVEHSTGPLEWLE